MADREITIPRLDSGSFTAPERREVQERFGVDFRILTRYISDRMFGDGTKMPNIQDPSGKQLFADEILQAFYAVQMRRSDPSITDENLDEVDLMTLMGIDRSNPDDGEVDPKAEPSSSSESTRT